MPSRNGRINAFNIQPGRILAGKYLVQSKLGGGWEGEVYEVVETRTGITRAAKLFFPHRNENDRAVTFYAKKLERLRNCDIVIQYLHSETIRVQNKPITLLISEFVQGELLRDLVRRQPEKRLHYYEALHLIYSLAVGLEQIQMANEYHGDLHDQNVLVRRTGIFFDIKLVDFYHWGKPTKAHLLDDVLDLIRLLYDALGGSKYYKYQPQEIKDIVRGLRRTLIAKQFPTARHLREHLEKFKWNG
jgi:serine/threonine protein kinase